MSIFLLSTFEEITKPLFRPTSFTLNMHQNVLDGGFLKVLQEENNSQLVNNFAALMIENNKSSDTNRTSVEVNLKKALKFFKDSERNKSGIKYDVPHYAENPLLVSDKYTQDNAAGIRCVNDHMQMVNHAAERITQAFNDYSYPKALVSASSVRSVLSPLLGKEIGIIDYSRLEKDVFLDYRYFEENFYIKPSASKEDEHVIKTAFGEALDSLKNSIKVYNSTATDTENRISKPVFSALVKKAAEKHFDTDKLWPDNSAYAGNNWPLAIRRKEIALDTLVQFKDRAMGVFILDETKQKNVAAR